MTSPAFCCLTDSTEAHTRAIQKDTRAGDAGEVMSLRSRRLWAEDCSTIEKQKAALREREAAFIVV